MSARPLHAPFAVDPPPVPKWRSNPSRPNRGSRRTAATSAYRVRIQSPWGVRWIGILGPEARVQRMRIGEEYWVGRTEEGRAVDLLSVATSFVGPRAARAVVFLKWSGRQPRHAGDPRATQVPERSTARATRQTCCSDTRLGHRAARLAGSVIPPRIRHLSAAERIRGGFAVDRGPRVCRGGDPFRGSRSSRGDANRARDHASSGKVSRTAAGSLAALARLVPPLGLPRTS